ncbi:MAG: hypothetical protein ACOCPZ_01080 [Natrialbaceae archaeon]
MRGIPAGAFLTVADEESARRTLRNTCNAYEDAVVHRFGGAAAFEPTEFGAFLAFRLREKHGDAVRVVRTVPVDPQREPFRRAHEAAVAFERREHESTPYPKFASGTDHPQPEEMRDRDLPVGGRLEHGRP